ncbi:MAG: 2-phospho-L-lactate guanylyltransferase [Actinomycetota bacterium]
MNGAHPDPPGRDSIDGAPLAVVIPVKSFAEAKGRLADSLTSEERRALAQRMAEGVIAAARPLPTWVVCHDHDIARWAMGQGARVLWRSSPGLNRAITAAVDTLGGLGIGTVIIAHGDLPLARTLAWVGEFDGVTIVPDRRGQGTNVMAVPTGTGFTFAYGVGSAPLHRAEAEQRGLAVRVIDDEALGWDVDVAADLDVFADGGGGRLTVS